jgi:hypothetical protein
MWTRWFVGLSLDEAGWNHSTFSANRERLPKESMMHELFGGVVAIVEWADRGYDTAEFVAVIGFAALLTGITVFTSREALRDTRPCGACSQVHLPFLVWRQRGKKRRHRPCPIDFPRRAPRDETRPRYLRLQRQP